MLLALALTLVATSGPPAPAQAAPAAQGLTGVVPVLGVLVGWNHRNRIYRDANAFIADRNRYYDSLRDTARKQLADREIAGLRPSQVAAYTKLVALIEGNRQAEIAVAEARKREARAAFNRRIEGVVLQRLLGTGAIQRVFGALTKGVHTSQDLLDTAIDKVSGGGGGILAEVEKVRTIARDVERVAGAIGGRAGAGLRRAAGKIATTIERPQQLVKADLEQVKSEIGELGGAVDTLARAGRTPSAGAVIERMVVRPPDGSDDPSVEAVAILISKLSVGDGSLRDQAKAAIEAGFVARCVAIADAYRQSLARLAGEGSELSVARAAAPCNAINPDQLIEQAQQAEAVDSGTPSGDGTPVPASVEIVSADVDQANCGGSTVNSWTYCDVTITFNVTFETPTLPADLRCNNFTSHQTLPLQVRRGSVSVPVTEYTKNVTVLGAEGWATCELVINDTVVAMDSLE
jgi:hypothetical protein